MQAIQTFWSVPLLNREHENFSYAGWYSELSFYMGTALSFLSISKYYPDLLLITDSFGEKLLVEQLGLEYARVENCLNSFSCIHKDLWALPKLHSYTLLKKPFLHFDNDIFIWSPLSNRVHSAPLVIQNYERLAVGPYKNAILTVWKNFRNVNSYIREINIDGITISINAGVIGGNDYSFFDLYVAEATKLVQDNVDKLHLLDKHVFNTIYEQHLFYEMAKEKGTAVETVLESDNVLVTWNMNLVPALVKFVHLLGEGKKNPLLCEQVIMRMKYEFPEHFEKILYFYLNKGNIGERDKKLLAPDYFDKKFEKLNFAYNFLKNDICIILNTKFKLRKEILFSKRKIDGKEEDIVIRSTNEKTEIIKPLLKWDKLLLYFKELTSAEEVFQYIVRNGWVKNEEQEKLRFNILDMITKNWLYYDIIEF